MKRPQIFGKTLFVDLMMSTLVMVTFLLRVSNALERQKQKLQEAAGLNTEGIYAVVVEWPDRSNDDVDLYVRDPAGNIVYFNARDLGLMHLEHDDQGALSDTARLASGDITVDKNEERVILRGAIPGEYVVNVHMYDKRDAGPTPVTVRLMRLKGADTAVAAKKFELTAKGEERTAFRFRLATDGSLIGTNELPRSLIGGGRRGGF